MILFQLSVCHDHARPIALGALDGGAHLRAQTVSDHHQQIIAGDAQGNPQISIGRARNVETLLARVDQHRTQRKAVVQSAARQSVEVGCSFGRRFRRGRRRDPLNRLNACRKRDFSWPATAHMTINAMLF